MAPISWPAAAGAGKRGGEDRGTGRRGAGGQEERREASSLFLPTSCLSSRLSVSRFLRPIQWSRRGSRFVFRIEGLDAVCSETISPATVTAKRFTFYSTGICVSQAKVDISSLDGRQAGSVVRTASTRLCSRWTRIPCFVTCNRPSLSL